MVLGKVIDAHSDGFRVLYGRAITFKHVYWACYTCVLRTLALSCLGSDTQYVEVGYVRWLWAARFFFLTQGL